MPHLRSWLNLIELRHDPLNDRHFIKLSQLFDEGYYNKELDFIEVGLKIGPCNYYQATKDQLGLIQAK